MTPSPDPDLPRPRWTGALLLALLGLVLLREQPPAPRGADIPVTEFSAARAADHIAGLIPEGRAHPIGSAENLAVRDRLVARLRNLGLEPELTERVACRPRARCGVVRNVMVRIPGEENGPAVLVAVHYDSVPAGPGVGDDLSGVAVALEVASALVAGPAPRRPVWLLFDDGEEAGLLGARAFTDDPELVAGVGIVINVEARGSGGLARMFETSGPNAWMVGVAADAALRPSMTSLSVEIYRRMPNDTDLTVFREAGIQGLNHAFIRNLSHYHSPLDDLDHLDRGTLQHQGDTVLATTRALADVPALGTADADAVYGDVVGLFVVSWSAPWSMPLALLALALAFGAAFLAVRRRITSVRGVLLGMVVSLGAVVGSAALGFLVGTGIAWLAGTRVPPSAVPVWGAACILCVVGVVSLGAAALLTRRHAVGAAVGAWILWAGLGTAMAAVAPGVCILYVVPALLGAGALLPAVITGRHLYPALCLGVVTAALLVGPLTIGLFDAFEFGMYPVLAVPLSLVAITAVPGLCPPTRRAQRAPLFVALLLVGVTLLAAGLAPVYTNSQPGTLNLIRVDDRVRETATWYAETRGGELPLSGFSPAARRVPGAWGPIHQKAAAPVDRTAARLEPVAGAPGRYRLVSPRGSTLVGLAFPPGMTPARPAVGGKPVSPTRLEWFDGTERVYFDVVGLPEEGVELEPGVPAGTVIELADVSYGLSGAEADALRAERPANWVPKHSGDRDVVVSAQTLGDPAG